jgi:hypothetical protein
VWRGRLALASLDRDGALQVESLRALGELAFTLSALLSQPPLGQEALKECRTLLRVILTARFQKRLANLSHTASFGRCDRFQFSLKICLDSKGYLSVLFHARQILPRFSSLLSSRQRA